MTIPNQAPSGVWGSKKEEAKRLRARRPGCARPAGPTQKRILRSSITPNFDLLTFDLIQKNKPSKKWGASITPNFEGFGGFPEVRSQTSMRSRAWTEPKKKMARWYRRYRRSSYRRTGKHWSPAQVVNTQTSSGSQKSLPIAFSRTGNEWGPVTRPDRS